MGLLDGLQSLQGAPPPNPQPLSTANPASSTSDPLAQFSAGARFMFGDLGSKLSETLSPAVDNINETAKSSVTSIRRMMTDEPLPEDVEAPPAPQQMSISEEMSSMFNLTMFQRISLFAMCFGTGVLLIGLSFTFLPIIVLVPHKFAASFTMGNVLAIASTWILVGPRAQIQNMFHPVRAVASSVYLFSLVFTLFAAFFGGKFRYIMVLAALVAEVLSRKFLLPFRVIDRGCACECELRNVHVSLCFGHLPRRATLRGDVSFMLPLW